MTKLFCACLTAAIICGMSLAVQAADYVAEVDFSQESGSINPRLHSAGFAPFFYNRAIRNRDDDIKALNLSALRTHDWALFNPGQRIIDTHFIFPLMHLDPKDPKNYYFKPTDKIFDYTRKMGVDVFYRLGTSIEHTGEAGHYNILVPEDYEKYAEVLAGIVRHYTKGWADGYTWDIKYWEIWNEPDGITNCWGGNGESHEVLREKFIKFFVTVLKRLKSEFPELKIGGPALCWLNQDYFKQLLNACKEAGVAPDFISWHYYGADQNDLGVDHARAARQMCDKLGFKNTELIINEWHYLITWDGLHGNAQMASPDMIERAQTGPTGHNNIDSATFNLNVMSKWQREGILDQAFYYGSGASGNWGFMDGSLRLTKTYYSLKMMGEIVGNCEKMAPSKPLTPKIETLAAWSKDGKSAYLLVSEFRGYANMLTLAVKGADHAKSVEATVLDYTRDCLPVDVTFKNGLLTLVKKDGHSAAFLVKFIFD